MNGQFFSRKEPRFPSGGFYLERPQIQKLLEGVLRNPVVTVNAGWGYGKTWSVYSFLQNSKAIGIWIQLSAMDNGSAFFWENLCGTVKLRNRELGTAMSKIGFPETSRQFDEYRRLVEQTIHQNEKYVIVFDDFHLIKEPKMLRFLDRCLAAPFPGTSIILISQNEPDINAISLLSKGLLVRVSEEDLRFSPEEIAEYFRRQDLFLEPEDLEQIRRDSEGWVLILNLIAQDLKAKKPGEKYYPERMKAKVFKIIDEDYFASFSEDMRKLLIKFSLVEHRPRDLLEKLSPNRDLIDDIEKLNPMIRYDSYLHIYHAHKLLVEFLRERQGELSPEEIRQVYECAAAWCIENNVWLDAAAYYDQARDYQRLLDLACDFPELMSPETAAFFLELIDDRQQRQPAEDGAGIEDEHLAFLRYAVRPRLILALARFEESAAECRRIIEQFESLPFSPLGAKILTMAHTCLGSIAILTCRRTGDYRYPAFFEKAAAYFDRNPFSIEGPLTQCSVPTYLCQVGYPAEKGRFENAIKALGATVPLASRILNGFLSGTDSLAWCEFYYFKGNLDAAENQARLAVFRARENKQRETENRGLFFLLRIGIHTGNHQEIESLFRQLEAQLEEKDHFNRFILHDIVSGWFYAQTGNIKRIASWLKEGFEKSDLNSLLRPFETLVKAKCAFAEKQYHALIRGLEAQNPRGIESFYLGKLETTLLKAAARYRLGNTQAALADLEAAYGMAAPHAFDMPFIELGEDMRLLAAAVPGEKTAIPPKWLEKIRSGASAYGKKLGIAAEFHRAEQEQGPEQRSLEQGSLEHGSLESPSVFILRRQEAIILRALSQGYTRDEIARKENISLNAVKENIKNLYEKLGALNRADAIRIANSRGLLRKSEKSSH
jgi:LuxR family maltose regulon positive regulatory protein